METLMLELAPWQVRMVKDFTGQDIHEGGVISILFDFIKCPASYRIPVEGLSKRDWILYLTDEQMNIVQKKFKLKSPITGINITERQIKKGEVKFQDGSFDIKLTPWQIRMANDFLDLKKRVKVVTIHPGVIRCPASYKIPIEGLSRRDWVLYLTEDHMKLVQEKFNLETPVSGINITDGLIKNQEIVFH